MKAGAEYFTARSPTLPPLYGDIGSLRGTSPLSADVYITADKTAFNEHRRALKATADLPGKVSGSSPVAGSEARPEHRGDRRKVGAQRAGSSASLRPRRSRGAWRRPRCRRRARGTRSPPGPGPDAGRRDRGLSPPPSARPGGALTALDVVESHYDRIVVDVTCNASDADHADAITDAVAALAGCHRPQGQRPDLPHAPRRQARGRARRSSCGTATTCPAPTRRASPGSARPSRATRRTPGA